MTGRIVAGEFDIIESFFQRELAGDRGVVTGIGDDGAVLNPPQKSGQIVLSCDTLVESVHFRKQDSDSHAADLGYRCLAVSLSDLAAMGAEPLWFTLALTIPHANRSWLREFSNGLHSCAAEAGIDLVGGDTCRGPLVCTIQVAGVVPPGQALLRSGAGVDEAIYVSGDLGAAAAWIRAPENNTDGPDMTGLEQRFWRPQPQLALGMALRGVASSAIDVSDGLVSDLSHVLRASKLGAIVDLEKLPLCEALAKSANHEQTVKIAAAGGDDYQLCFTVPRNCENGLPGLGDKLGVRLTQIGKTTPGDSMGLFYNGQPVKLEHPGFQHFVE